MELIKNYNKFARNMLILITVIGVICFVTFSFYEKEIMNFFVYLFSNNIIKFISMLSYKFGNLIIVGLILPIFVCVAFVYLLDLNKNCKLFYSMHLNRRKLTTWLAIIYILIFLLIFGNMGFQQVITYLNDSESNQIIQKKAINNVNMIDPHFLYTFLTTGLADIFTVCFIAILNLLIYFIGIFPKIDNNHLVNNYYLKPFLTMLIFIFVSYFCVFFLKHIFGRPLYMNAAWTREQAIKNGLNPNYSIESRFEIYGWSNLFDPSGMAGGKYSNADYYNWWEPNNLKENLKNFWRWPESWVNDNGDHHWDMDFPSGHIFSYGGLLVGTYSFYFSKYYKINKKFSPLQKITLAFSLLLFTISSVTLIIQMFHWPTDVAFSITIMPLMFWISIKIMKYVEKTSLFFKIKYGVNF